MKQLSINSALLYSVYYIELYTVNTSSTACCLFSAVQYTEYILEYILDGLLLFKEKLI